jgi:hypothetical protein
VLTRLFSLLLLIFTLFLAKGQCETLQFIDVGSVPAQCRTAPYQSGHGILYGGATGGTPDYEYTWINLQTGQLVINAVLGGLNSGDYYFKVVDDIGCVIDTIVKLDSVAPFADFDILAAEQMIDGGGIPVIEVEIEISSVHWDFEYIDPSWFMYPDTLNKVSIDSSAWEIATSEYSNFYSFGDIGYHEICLTTSNHNGCSDTICKSITIGDWVDGSALLNITSSSVSGNFFIELLIGYPVVLNLYDLSGTPVSTQSVVPGPNIFNFTTGQYVYDVVDPITDQVLASGTFFVL